LETSETISRKNPSFFYNKDWANRVFRQALILLKEGARSEGFWLWNQRLAAVLLLKKELEEKGYFWQSKRLENHIHRLQPRKADSEKSNREPSFRKNGGFV
jgi:hypothetical protein